jgi:hypothetical protein
MTEPKETPRVRHAEFFKKPVPLSPYIIYSMCSFDECDIYVRPGDLMPEFSCHFDKCIIHLKDGVTPHNFLAAISRLKGSSIHGKSGCAVWERDESYPVGCTWFDCKIVSNNVERDMYEAVKEIKERIYGKDPDEMAWWEDQEKQRAARRAKTDQTQ